MALCCPLLSGIQPRFCSAKDKGKGVAVLLRSLIETAYFDGSFASEILDSSRSGNLCVCVHHDHWAAVSARVSLRPWPPLYFPVMSVLLETVCVAVQVALVSHTRGVEAAGKAGADLLLSLSGHRHIPTCNLSS